MDENTDEGESIGKFHPGPKRVQSFEDGLHHRCPKLEKLHIFAKDTQIYVKIFVADKYSFIYVYENVFYLVWFQVTDVVIVFVF